MKVHLNLATSDLDAGVSFYSTLLDAQPSKRLDDYALFVTEEPALELALDLRSRVALANDAHFGIYVENSATVDAAIQRLEAAGLATTIEREETCCYANQTKVWTRDPEGRRWEIYTVHEETVERDDANTTCCAAENVARECCIA